MSIVATMPSSKSASHRVRARLLDQFGQQWRAGHRLPGVRVLADALDVAPGTVHRALRSLVRDGLLEARPRSGMFVTRQFQAAQKRAHEQSGNNAYSIFRDKTIDVVFSNGPDSFIRRMAEHVIQKITDNGGQINDRSQPVRRDDPSWDISNSQADAVVIFNMSMAYGKLTRDRPMLLVTTSVTDPSYDLVDLDLVSVDQEQGSILAGRALRDADCKTACMVGHVGKGEQFDLTSETRWHGFQKGFGGDEKKVKRLYSGWYGEYAGAQSVMQYVELATRPQGVFCASDEIAVGFANGAAAHGLMAGVDYQLVGFDGQDAARNRADGHITTIAVPTMQMADKALETLAHRLANPDAPRQKTELGCTLLEGMTTRQTASKK